MLNDVSIKLKKYDYTNSYEIKSEMAAFLNQSSVQYKLWSSKIICVS